MKLLGAVAIVVVVVIAGYGGNEDGGKYNASDVRRAFAAMGLELRSERIRATTDPCELPASITGIDPDTVGCASIVIPVEGMEPTEESVADLPTVAFWNTTERLHWAVWLYPTEDDAKGVVSQPGYLSSWRAERSRFVQKGNVVAVYIRPEDEDRLRDALEHL